MSAAPNRTFICSIVFLDIVGYSKKPVSEQIQLKERLNALLTEALANVAVNDRIILDTGDGAALSFLGDPEDALFACLTMREAIASPLPHGPGPGNMPLRIGINLGPVKLVKDINGQPNIIGDGINVAQRVMSFAEAGQVLVSRSYYEVVSCLSEDYVKLFHYEGARTDKHVREHEVYAVQATEEMLKHIAAESPRRKKEAEAGDGKGSALDTLTQSASIVTDGLRRRPKLVTALTVVSILATAVVLRLNRESAEEPVAAPTPPKRVAAAPAPVRDAAKASAPEKPAPKAVPARKPEPAPASGPGTVGLTILPWGEVYINGRMHGVSPPLREVELKPGRYKIEIRNSDFPPHVEVVEVQAGSRIRIRHRFR